MIGAACRDPLPAAPAAAARARVLLVDDSFLMRGVLRGIVEQDAALTVIGEACDGLDALQKLPLLAPDVVLLDIEMPRLDGFGFLEQARLSCAARVIVVSSIVQPGAPQLLRALELGAHDVLPKPSGALSLDLGARSGRQLLAAIHACLAA